MATCIVTLNGAHEAQLHAVRLSQYAQALRLWYVRTCDSLGSFLMMSDGDSSSGRRRDGVPSALLPGTVRKALRPPISASYCTACAAIQSSQDLHCPRPGISSFETLIPTCRVCVLWTAHGHPTPAPGPPAKAPPPSAVEARRDGRRAQESRAFLLLDKSSEARDCQEESRLGSSAFHSFSPSSGFVANLGRLKSLSLASLHASSGENVQQMICRHAQQYFADHWRCQ